MRIFSAGLPIVHYARGSRRKILPTKIWICRIHHSNFGLESTPLSVHQNLSIMANAKQPNRVQLLQAVTKSVNKVAFNPSKARKDDALKAIDALRSFVVAQSKPKASKPKAKSAPSVPVDLEAVVEFLVKQGLVQLPTEAEPKPKAKPKAKRKAKKATSTKRTPSEIVADSDEMKQQTKDVGPITKSKRKTASVPKAKKAVERLGKRNAAAKAAKVAQKKQHNVSIPNDCAFSLNEGESPQDAIRRQAIQQAKREALEAALLAQINTDETTGQIELNF
tara:strand:+ start:33 stop:866 length:834 start_codon:yes stop_codon:yes gene_type:complete